MLLKGKKGTQRREEDPKGKNKLRRWELALMLGVCVAALGGTWLSGQQRALSEKVVRLHVVGASDALEEQLVKLRVRDAVLEAAEPWLEDVQGQGAARAVLGEHLEELARAGAEAAEGRPVTAALEENVWFPTRQYTGFSLPAGRYTALRITVGEGKGRNWWCVVFPPLCMDSVTQQTAEVAGLTGNQVGLITGEEGYEVRFKALEFWNELTEKLGKE